MSNDYDSLIDKGWDDIPADVLPPDGLYLLGARNITWFAAEEGNNKKGRMVIFHTIKSPVEVPQELLDELPDDYDFADEEVAFTIWVRRPSDLSGAVYRTLTEKYGIQPPSPIFGANGKLNPEIAKVLRGAEVVGRLAQRTVEGKSGSFTESRVEEVNAVEA